jgi:hypothetical protein
MKNSQRFGYHHLKGKSKHIKKTSITITIGFSIENFFMKNIRILSN